VLGDGGGVTVVSEEPVLAVLHLEGDTAGAGGDDGTAAVEGFGDFDFEAFAGGELKGDFSVGHCCVEDCTIH